MVGVAVGMGVSVAVGVRVGVSEGVGLGPGVGEWSGVGVPMGVSVGRGVSVIVGVGLLALVCDGRTMASGRVVGKMGCALVNGWLFQISSVAATSRATSPVLINRRKESDFVFTVGF